MGGRQFSLAFIVAVGTVSPPCWAQSLKEYKGEIIMTADGKLVAPWIERKMCDAENKNCRLVIYRRDTREVARVDGRWSTKFEETRNGEEARRAEAAMAKTVRLKSAAAVSQ